MGGWFGGWVGGRAGGWVGGRAGRQAATNLTNIPALRVVLNYC